MSEPVCSCTGFARLMKRVNGVDDCAHAHWHQCEHCGKIEDFTLTNPFRTSKSVKDGVTAYTCGICGKSITVPKGVLVSA